MGSQVGRGRPNREQVGGQAGGGEEGCGGEWESGTYTTGDEWIDLGDGCFYSTSI